MVDLTGEKIEPRLLCEAGAETVSWGLADFIAAEELDRVRGFWWLPDGSGLLVERCDEAGVAINWISDPAQPEVEPRPHRYPAAGRTNALVELWQVPLDGPATQLTWDRQQAEYLATVMVDRAGSLVCLLSRDQRTYIITRVDLGGSALVEIARRTDEFWVDVRSAAPQLDPTGALVDIVVDPDTDTYRLSRDGVYISPARLQINAIVDVTADAIHVLASPDPTEQHLYRIDPTSFENCTQLTTGQSWHSAVVAGTTAVIVSTDLATPKAQFTVINPDGEFTLASNSAEPNLDIKPIFATVGPDDLRACLLWPTGYQPGSGPLPVIMAPYGGPHAQMVIRAASIFATDQWLADQGFAVIIVDGRGTPGRGPAWERAVKGDLASGILADQVTALQALGRRYPDLDTSRVGITGWSFGGFLAALAVIDRPDVFHAAIAGAPVTEWRLYDTGYTERYLGDPDADSEGYDRSSLLTRASNLTRPLLMIHGLADDNVLAAHTLRLSSALLAAGRQHFVLPLSGVTHMTPQEVVAENLLLLQVEFFRQHLSR